MARALLPFLVATLGACATAPPPCPCTEPATTTTLQVASAAPAPPPVVTATTTTTAPATGPAPPPSAHAIALARARVDAAEKLYETRLRMWQSGKSTITALLVAPRLAHAAFAEAGLVGDARVAWATKNVERITQLDAIAKVRFDQGMAGQDEVAEIATARAEAEFWLEEARLGAR